MICFHGKRRFAEIVGRRARFIAALFAGLGTACSKEAPVEEPPAELAVAPIEYRFPGIDGQVVDSMSHRGRVTVLLFVTTFDLASQAQAQRLEDLYRSHVPRLNAVAVVMEAPRHVDLARSFREVLNLHYEVAIADRQAVARQGALRVVQQVPAWVVVDAKGTVRAAAVGGVSPQELTRLVRMAEN